MAAPRRTTTPAKTTALRKVAITPPGTEEGIHELQGVVNGIDTTEQLVTFKGEKFRIAEKVGLMPLMKFAHASSQDMSTADMEALSAIYSMLEDCIYAGEEACGKCAACKKDNPTDCKQYDAGDWRKFVTHAIKTKADADELLPVVRQVIELIAARPTQEQSGSSNGSAPISQKSTDISSGEPALV